MAREVFVLEEKDGEEFAPRNAAHLYCILDEANRRCFALAERGKASRVVRYVPEDELERRDTEIARLKLDLEAARVHIDELADD